MMLRNAPHRIEMLRSEVLGGVDGHKVLSWLVWARVSEAELRGYFREAISLPMCPIPRSRAAPGVTDPRA